MTTRESHKKAFYIYVVTRRFVEERLDAKVLLVLIRAQKKAKARKSTARKNNGMRDKTKNGYKSFIFLPACLQFLTRLTGEKAKSFLFSSFFHFHFAIFTTKKASESEKCVDDLKKGLWHDGGRR